MWQFCGRVGFHLHTPIETFRVTCAPEAVLAERQGPDRAVRGRDGMYHLIGDDQSYCTGSYDRSDWCTSQIRHSTELTLDVPSVPPADRCYRAHGPWPPPLTGTKALARIRRQLVATFGPGCVLCPDPWARKVDHDHITGEVRGYLCGSCNAALAECRHLTGCRFITYLTEPPVRRLSLVYPSHTRLSAQPKQVARRTCFDLAMAGGVSPGIDILLDARATQGRPPSETATSVL